MIRSLTSSRGIGLPGAVFLVFLTLKLTGHVVWSWWWVTAPLWGAALLVVLVFLGVLAFQVILDRRRAR